MINVYYYGLNENEVNALKSVLEVLKYPLWTYIDIKKMSKIKDIQGSLKTKSILVFDETKAKSAFEKRLDLLFEDGNAVNKFSSAIRINRPNKFMKSQALIKEILVSILPLCTVKEKTFEPTLINLLKNATNSSIELNSKSFTISDEKGVSLRIVPENAATNPKIPSITYNELIVIMAIKEIYSFDKLKIVE